MATYNGHRSWAAWNVNLWINNDEGLYHRAVDLVRVTKKQHLPRESAARIMLNMLNREGTTETPDGARYTLTSIREALRDIDT